MTLNDRTRNNGAKLIVKFFNTSVAQLFYPIKITTTQNALPNEVVSSTVNSFNSFFVQKLHKIPELTGSNSSVHKQQQASVLLKMDPTVCPTTTTTTSVYLIIECCQRDAVGVLFCPCRSTILQYTHLKLLDRVVPCLFFTWVFKCYFIIIFLLAMNQLRY